MEGESGGIAIVGVGCRFPGANNIDEFWQILAKGENHVTEIPSERWNLEAYYDEDADAPGKMYPRKAGFLSNFDEFDFKLFEINEKEAQRMDPQQKYILECVFMALQDGGFTKKCIHRSKTGVFIGVMNDDYSRLTSRNDMNHYSVTGGSTSIMSARISYAFDLRGPCLSLNTACSSSLVAVHLGCQSLKSGECNMAICGGVNSLLTPSIFIQLSKSRMVSRTGQCQAFSANADGYARGEGCGIVLLKKLSDALRDGDNIWATIVTGTNQDGRAATPMTAPSGEQQYQLLKTVYEEAGIDAEQIDYIEAHGTGTVAGDPVEVNSLGRFFLERADNKIRYIGSVKTNIGHLESAAGIAGMIKVLLMMKNNKIVESLLTGEQNPRIDFQKFHFQIPTKLTNWDKENKVACVNSFAFGGTNCHAVLSTHTEIRENKEVTNSEVPLLFCFSGQDENALQESIQEFIKFCETHTERDVKSISYTSTVRRDHLQIRRSVAANSLDELVDKLKSAHSAESFRPRKKLIFVFGGMGIAWNGMCKELITEFQVFKEKIREIDKYLKKYVSWSLYEKLLDDFDVSDPVFGPISIFACQVALAALWEHSGITPDSVLGQSIGEVAASHIAGIWSLKEAVKIIFYRTSVLANIGTGKMMLIRNYSASSVEKILPKYDSRANIALFYSPKSCVISGDTDVVEKIEKDLLSSPDIQDSIICQTLRLNTAFHSHHTEDSKNEILETLSGMQGSKPKTEIISTVNGEKAKENDFSTPDYWGNNIRKPVLFGKAVVNATEKDKFNIFVEIGPKPVLGNNIADLFTDENVVSVPSMKRKAELICFMESIGKLYEYGCSLNWQNLYDKPQKNTASPKYTFCRSKCLHISEDKRQELMGMEPNNNLHPFLKTIDCSHEHKIIVSPKSIPSVYEHRFSGRILIPGALYAEAGFAIAKHHFRESETASVSVKFKHPVILQIGRIEELDVYKHVSEEAIGFVIEKKGNKFVEGTIEKKELYPDITIDVQNVKMRCTETLTKQNIYENLQDIGMTFGNVLQLLGDSVRNDSEVLSNLILNSDIKQEMKETTLHPAVLDAMLQTTSAFHQKDSEKQKSLPVQIEGLTIRKRVEDRMLVYTKLIKQTNIFKQFHIKLLSPDGSLLAEIERFITKALGSQGEELLFQMEWIPTAIIRTDVQTSSKGKWLIVTDKNQREALSNNFCAEYIETNNANYDFAQKLQMKSRALQAATAIIFLCPQEILTQTSLEILKPILKQSLKLQELIKHLSNMGNINIPLFVITQNAVHVRDNISLNLVGASFWGLFRTVMREKMYEKALLVDIHANEKSSFLMLIDAAVSHLLKQDITDGPNEFVVEENTIWSQQIIPNEEMPLYRNNHSDELCKANLYVENEDIFKAHLQYDDEERQSSRAGDTTVFVTSLRYTVHLCFLSFFPQMMHQNILQM